MIVISNSITELMVSFSHKIVKKKQTITWENLLKILFPSYNKGAIKF